MGKGCPKVILTRFNLTNNKHVITVLFRAGLKIQEEESRRALLSRPGSGDLSAASSEPSAVDMESQMALQVPPRRASPASPPAGQRTARGQRVHTPHPPPPQSPPAHARAGAPRAERHPTARPAPPPRRRRAALDGRGGRAGGARHGPAQGPRRCAASAARPPARPPPWGRRRRRRRPPSPPPAFRASPAESPSAAITPGGRLSEPL